LTIAVVSRTQQLLRLSTSDPLTTLFNRGYFSERIAAEVSRANRYQLPLTIAMVDVDEFKSFNDRHGHAAGDKVLKLIAEKLRHSFRQSDIVARYGGEEFIIAMPQTNVRDASKKLEDFRKSLSATPVEISRQSGPTYLTFSAGVANFPDDALSEEELIAIADERLFAAKRNGRNQIVTGKAADLAGRATESR